MMHFIAQGYSTNVPLIMKTLSRSISVIPGNSVQLNNIWDNEGALKKKKRLGRGIGSGKGKTCGRGHKGQKSRSGGKSGRGQGFEGGQTPLYRRIPKVGFTNAAFRTPMEPLNVSKLQYYIDMGRIDASQPIQLKTLQDSGIVGRIKHGVKLLGGLKEHLSVPVEIEVSRASASAIAAVEAVGGSIKTMHFNRLGLRSHLKPEKFDILPKLARPPPKLMHYYTDDDKRGYLSSLVQAKKVNQQNQEGKEILQAAV